jgi:hypothetical protein
VFVDTGALNFQYPKAEAYWRDYLTQRGAAEFRNVSSSTADGSTATLCDLVQAARPSGALAVGAVRYSQAHNHTLFLALTIVRPSLLSNLSVLTSITAQANIPLLYSFPSPPFQLGQNRPACITSCPCPQRWPCAIPAWRHCLSRLT